MARLNEPPVAPGPSLDTIEALRRRFLRQNRELAKTNSQQSIRIRSLENDASRLLAENLTLREQVLHLENALEAESNRPSFDVIDAVRNQLQSKIDELGGLVAGLGHLQKTDDLPRCKSQTAATRRSPDERQWRSGLGLQDVHNAMLPTITEDKFFPRKTMNAEELQYVLEDPDSQSPDIGPPPVSRFDSEDPISYDPNSTPDEQAEEPADESDPPLSANLETRRKRRESGPKLDLRRMSVFQSPPREKPVEEPTKAIRAGAKRKFSVQDDREKAETQSEPFNFTRRNTPSVANDEGLFKEEARPSSPERPVLGNKPVNTDPLISPKKQRSSATSKPDNKGSTTTKSSNGRLTITRRPTQEVPPLHIPIEQPDIAEINLESLPPKTPAADEIFSPPSTDPSTQRADSNDTPPPGDIGSGLGARPSRRVRAQVSYKEPALNVKMRRPGKELVDAVQLPPDKRNSQAMPSTVEKISLQNQSDGKSVSWNALPPESIRSANEEPGSPLRQKLDRREGQGTDSGAAVEPPKLNSSAASNAISALLKASTAKRRSSVTPIESEAILQPAETTETADTNAPAAKDEEKDNLAIFDFNESSPADSSSQARLSKVAKSSRRHSTIVPSASTTEHRRLDSESRPKPNVSLPSLHTRTASGSGTGIRSSSTSNPNKSTTASRGLTKEKKPSAALPTSGSHIDLKAAAMGVEGPVPNVLGKGIGSLRAERAASRRKSMML